MIDIYNIWLERRTLLITFYTLMSLELPFPKLCFPELTRVTEMPSRSWKCMLLPGFLESWRVTSACFSSFHLIPNSISNYWNKLTGKGTFVAIGGCAGIEEYDVSFESCLNTTWDSSLDDQKYQVTSRMSTPNAILDKLSASNIFDLTGVVAVVTGGGTVSKY